MAARSLAPSQMLSISQRRVMVTEASGRAACVLRKESGSGGWLERKLCHWEKEARGSHASVPSPKTADRGGRERRRC
jgi:hypothetical protein